MATWVLVLNVVAIVTALALLVLAYLYVVQSITPSLPE
jgi:hypothetical protein